ncbi:hypothetical protein [Desulfosarcina cetonica]|uniref:hypothetical protein n=1 Tax=Desulfosarcina cetonica TaxID=90730 RepID=UPI00155DB375|nr:hypothetical protein [Desulfosarcina cetonica]
MTGIYHPDDRHASRQPGWKAYQERLKQRQRPPAPNRKKIQRNRPDLKFTGLLKITGLLIVLLVLVGGLFLYPKGGAEVPPAETPPAAASPKLAARIQKSDLRILLGQNHLTNVTQQPVQVSSTGTPTRCAPVSTWACSNTSWTTWIGSTRVISASWPCSRRPAD